MKSGSKDPAGILLRPLAGLLNRGLRDSSSAAALADSLEGNSLGIEISGTPLRFRLRVEATGIVIETGSGTTDATIAGPPLSIARALGADPQAPIRDGSVHFRGDTAVADRFRALLQAALPDIEEQLARLIGDPLAHAAGRGAREGREWLGDTVDSLGRSLAEYLREERRLLPSRTEFEEFAAAVDRLRDDVERAEARLALLRQGSSPGGSHTP